jgi:hypothetical protein
MSDCLFYRDEALSLIMTYENLMDNFDSAINRLSYFIRGTTPSTDIMSYLTYVLKSVTDEGHAKPKINYL